MIDLSFIDELLNDIVAFPITVFGILFFPNKIIGADADLPLSSPGVTLILAIAIFFYASRVQFSLEYTPKTEPSRNVDKEYIIYMALFGILFVMSQWLLISALFDLEVKEKTLAEVIGILTYTISVPLCLWGLVYLILIAFPIHRTIRGHTLLSIWDRAIKEVREQFPDEWTPADLAQENANGAAKFVTAIAYIIVSVNVIRIVLCPSGTTGDVAKVTAVFVFSGLVVFFIGIILIVRYQENLYKLTKHQRSKIQTEKGKAREDPFLKRSWF